MKLHFVSSQAPEAIKAAQKLKHLFGQTPREDTDVIVALGGDGLMLETVHTVLESGQAIFGMNRGSVGFLMNDFNIEKLTDRISGSYGNRYPSAENDRNRHHRHNPLRPCPSTKYPCCASSIRPPSCASPSMARYGLMSWCAMALLLPHRRVPTAYNLSAHGPILPINSPLLALTPISPFRPRRWRGAILSHEAELDIEVLEPGKRPVSAVADQREFRDIVRVVVSEDETRSARLLFDDGHSLAERVLNEQFQF